MRGNPNRFRVYRVSSPTFSCPVLCPPPVAAGVAAGRGGVALCVAVLAASAISGLVDVSRPLGTPRAKSPAPGVNGVGAFFARDERRTGVEDMGTACK